VRINKRNVPRGNLSIEASAKLDALRGRKNTAIQHIQKAQLDT
jgi:hypothetical protein